MKKFLKAVAVLVVLLAMAAAAGLWAFSRSRHADAAADAMAAMAPDAAVAVEQSRWLVFSPKQGEPRMGVVFYPGASCDVRGYAPVLRRLAAAGYLVVVVPMPLEFAFLAPDRALEAMADFPDVRRWAIVGHSLGGAMAAGFAYRHPDAVRGVVIWDSFPPPNNSLADFPHPVWHIHRARPDGSPPASFAERRDLFPPDSRWVPIRGGVHLYFGAFDGGGYVEDWEPAISRTEQHDQVMAATLAALQAMEEAS